MTVQIRGDACQLRPRCGRFAGRASRQHILRTQPRHDTLARRAAGTDLDFAGLHG